jgi:hypothetical protein
MHKKIQKIFSWFLKFFRFSGKSVWINVFSQGPFYGILFSPLPAGGKGQSPGKSPGGRPGQRHCGPDPRKEEGKTGASRRKSAEIGGNQRGTGITHLQSKYKSVII